MRRVLTRRFLACFHPQRRLLSCSHYLRLIYLRVHLQLLLHCGHAALRIAVGLQIGKQTAVRIDAVGSAVVDIAVAVAVALAVAVAVAVAAAAVVAAGDTVAAAVYGCGVRGSWTERAAGGL